MISTLKIVHHKRKKSKKNPLFSLKKARSPNEKQQTPPISRPNQYTDGRGVEGFIYPFFIFPLAG